MARPKAFDLDKAQEQAMQLFWRKGYAATSIEDLVETLHLSRSSIYDTFVDKRSLFLMVLRKYSQQVLDRVAKVLDQSEQPGLAVQAIFDDLIAKASTSRGLQGCFMANSVAELTPYDQEVTDIAADYNRNMQQLFAQAFARAEAEGQMKLSHAPEALAMYVFNNIQGMRLLIKSRVSADYLEAIASITVKSLT